VLLLIILSSSGVHANSLKSVLKDSGIEVGGWINGGATYNANNPSDGFNGAVTFADRANQFQLNQLNLFLQRAVPSEGSEWALGGRFDFLFGTDAIYIVVNIERMPRPAFPIFSNFIASQTPALK